MKNTVKSLSSHIKKGDTVKVISGKDKGKVGEVTQILRYSHQVVIKDINIKKKHILGFLQLYNLTIWLFIICN